MLFRAGNTSLLDAVLRGILWAEKNISKSVRIMVKYIDVLRLESERRHGWPWAADHIL